jgi:hypothetical protein
VDVSVCDAEVRAPLVRAGEALCVQPLRCSPPAFHLAPGEYRRRRRLHIRREGAGEASGGAIARGAWLQEALERGVPRCCSQLDWEMMAPVKVTKPRQDEHEAEQEEEQEYVKGHQDPHRLK